MTQTELHRAIRIIITCARRVHEILGPGFDASVYQEALYLELESTPLDFTRDQSLPVRYEGEHVGDHRFDFALGEDIVVTLRTDARMGKMQHAQMDNLLHYFNLRSGLLLNFGGTRFQQKRVTNKKYHVFPFSLN